MTDDANRDETRHEYVDVYFGSGLWCGFTPPDEFTLPPNHGPWRSHARWCVYPALPHGRAVPEAEIRAGLADKNYYEKQLIPILKLTDRRRPSRGVLRS